MTTDERLDRIEKAIERLVERFNRLETYVLDFRDETSRRLELIERRLDVLSATAAAVELRLASICKAMLDSASFGTQLLRDQSRAKETVSELARTGYASRRAEL